VRLEKSLQRNRDTRFIKILICYSLPYVLVLLVAKIAFFEVVLWLPLLLLIAFDLVVKH